MTTTDPMRELFTANVREVRTASTTGQAMSLAGLLVVLVSALSVVGAAVTAVVLFAVVLAPMLSFAFGATLL
ncbi:hypothetical protein [Curtobacterium aetherium]|uniref:Uncharacterized protein n=1 Tax=Curtobacterium aetherium TaxID=2841594 RepID=A0ACD1E126_9MICO|nr:hypothetical protein [Curtobacterium sp. L6-1]QWS32634.1 hypothetical protein KM842_10070 [Curtobacterium sp. L6-1]